MKQGLLLINLGTPDAPDTASIRRYLREFLSDERVIQCWAPLRYLLLYGFILPFRTKKTTQAYQTIWTTEGSPLLCNSQQFIQKLKRTLSEQYTITLAMRYGQPSIQNALYELKDCSDITVIPLYPQYASATTGSTLTAVFKLLSKQTILPSIKTLRDFHNHPDYIKAQAKQIQPYVSTHEFILFSYHGLPINQLLKGDCKTKCQHHCSPSSKSNAGCYRAQCFRTTELLAKQLSLKPEQFTISFQSRLGKTTWIKPYTDETLEALAKQGIKTLAIACPSFVADCLETLEEIGLRARDQWIKLGGDTLTLIPSLNDNDQWIQAFTTMLQQP